MRGSGRQPHTVSGTLAQPLVVLMMRVRPAAALAEEPVSAREKRLMQDGTDIYPYPSPGREYSVLFDALGSSQARSLRDGNLSSFKGDATTSTADPAAPKVFFAGITDRQAYRSFGGALGVTMQAGEYVKFNAGLGLAYAQSHLITASDACNPDVKGGPGTSGPSRAVGSRTGGNATGTANPKHRQVIDLPGRRCSVDDTTIVKLRVSGTVMV